MLAQSITAKVGNLLVFFIETHIENRGHSKDHFVEKTCKSHQRTLATDSTEILVRNSGI